MNLKIIPWVVLGIAYFLFTRIRLGESAESIEIFSLLLAVTARILQAEIHHRER